MRMSAVPVRASFVLLAIVLILPAARALQEAPAAPPAPTPPQKPLAPLPQTSPITSVVVFPNHAEITRELVVEARAGENLTRFTNLVPILNPHTLRASVTEGARITGTELRTVHLEESLTEELAALETALAASQAELTAAAREEARLAESRAFLLSVKLRLSADMGRELAAGSVSVADWKQVLDFVRDGLAECDAAQAALVERLRERTREHETLEKQLKSYSGQKPREMREVTVAFVAERAGPIRVRVHYMVDSVAWKPSYDVHLDRARSEVAITAYGQIIQWTGEHWTDAELVLAMSRPDFELTVPELLPLQASLDDKGLEQLIKEVSFLGTSASDQAAKWSEWRFRRGQDRETFRRNLEQLARRTDKSLEQFGLNRRIIEGALMRLADRFAGTRYVLGRRETILCDSSPHKVVAFSARVPCTLQYLATPALGRSVMLRGVVANATGFPVVEGGAALFVDESYVGTGQVRSAAQNESLDFGFGPDDALVVTRRLVSREVKGPEAFRQSQVITYRYEVVIENFNRRVVAVEVVDQIPVSKSQEIRVEFLSASRQPEHDTASGTLRWTLEVPAEGRLVLEYVFTVECPVGRDVHWS